uniref:Putative secreted protein n=1 Tax=Ixodes ricinus TaxID=34613 RepID=A0A6B0V4G3_IXORI
MAKLEYFVDLLLPLVILITQRMVLESQLVRLEHKRRQGVADTLVASIAKVLPGCHHDQVLLVRRVSHHEVGEAPHQHLLFQEVLWVFLFVWLVRLVLNQGTDQGEHLVHLLWSSDERVVLKGAVNEEAGHHFAAPEVTELQKASKVTKLQQSEEIIVRLHRNLQKSHQFFAHRFQELNPGYAHLCEDFFSCLEHFVDIVHSFSVALEGQMKQRHLQGHYVFGRHVLSCLYYLCHLVRKYVK